MHSSLRKISSKGVPATMTAQQFRAFLGKAAPATPGPVVFSQPVKKPEEKKLRTKFNVMVDKTPRTSEDGLVFDSRFEKNCYEFLRKQRQVPFARQVRFVLQEPYVIPETGEKVRGITTVLDFVLGVQEGHEGPLPELSVVIDAKGFKTEAFGLKRKLFEKRYLKKIYCPKNMKEFESLAYEFINKFNVDRRCHR
jgi:hypothetical protein